jgi:hypothetical protein
MPWKCCVCLTAIIALGANSRAATLTPEKIREALRAPERLRSATVELLSPGFDRIEIRGDGTVCIGRPSKKARRDVPLPKAVPLREKLAHEQVAALLRLFADDEFLASPPKVATRNIVVYELRLTIPGVGEFRCTQPDYGHNRSWDKDAADHPVAERIIMTIRKTAARTERLSRIAVGDDLTDEVYLELLGDDANNVSLEYKAGGFGGGISLQLTESGQLSGEREPWGVPGRRKFAFAGDTGRETATDLIRGAVQRGLFDIVARRRIGIVDESRRQFALVAVRRGRTFRRPLKIWAGEARKVTAVQTLADQLYALASGRQPGSWEPERAARAFLIGRADSNARLPEETRERLKESYRGMRFIRAWPGQEIVLWDRSAMKLTADDVGPERCILFSAMPSPHLPMLVLKEEGTWLVAASPMTTRQAAAGP